MTFKDKKKDSKGDTITCCLKSLVFIKQKAFFLFCKIKNQFEMVLTHLILGLLEQQWNKEKINVYISIQQIHMYNLWIDLFLKV